VNLAAAVVLMAYGSPDRLEDVPAYYADIRGGRPIRPELLADLVERYRQLGIEHESPLNRITEETRAALEKELGLPVFTGMRHWRPRIAEAVEEALAVGAGTIVGLVLAPHYSKMSIGSYRAQLEKALAGRAELVFVESWGDDPAFVDFMAERIRAATASRSWGAAGQGGKRVARRTVQSSTDKRRSRSILPPAASGGSGAGLRPVGADADQGRERPHVVFTAHSLPARILDEGDPYEAQLFASSRLVAERAGVEEWSFCYQSESPTGEPWLGPDIVDHLTDLHARGIRDVLVCPIGFVADHLEIRWDIDTEARRRAEELGIRLARTDMPNAEPAFVQALAGLVREALRVPSEA
jgi:protoporphyrin/coproporphyrin ferrochelatase